MLQTQSRFCLMQDKSPCRFCNACHATSRLQQHDSCTSKSNKLSIHESCIADRMIRVVFKILQTRIVLKILQPFIIEHSHRRSYDLKALNSYRLYFPIGCCCVLEDSYEATLFIHAVRVHFENETKQFINICFCNISLKFRIAELPNRMI